MRLSKGFFQSLVLLILSWYSISIISHCLISSLHLIEHLIENNHYHLDEFHNIADDRLNNENHHTHGLVIDTFLSQANENESAEDIDEVLLQIFKLNQHIKEYTNSNLSSISIQGNYILANNLLKAQTYNEPLTPPPQNIS